MKWTECARRGTALAAVVGLLGLGAGAARAAVITSGGCGNVNVSCTLEELFDGESIAVNDKLFSNWLFSSEQDGSTVGVDFSQIDVVGLDDGGLDPGPGLRFVANSGALTVSSPDVIDFPFTFTVEAGPGFQIVDNSLELVGFSTTGSAFIEVAEVVFDAGGAPLATKLVTSDPAGSTFDSAAFAPQSSLAILTAIIVDASGGGSAALTSFEQRFSQQGGLAIPEPGTLASFGLGLVGLAWLARRGRRRAGFGHAYTDEDTDEATEAERPG